MPKERISIEGVKQIELEILKEFDGYCRKNNLRYSLGEGTLIGAVRHKGFIPWDDDIDVLMPRDDFDKFVKEYHRDRYKVIYPNSNTVFPFFYCRLTDDRTIIQFTDNNKDSNETYYEGGIFIDILPIDNFPDNQEKIHKHEKRMYPFFKLYRLIKRKGYFLKGSGFLRNILASFLKIMATLYPESLLRRKIYRMIVHYNNRETKNKGYWTNYWHHPWVFPAHVFDSYIELEFEKSRFMAISEYDEYLRCEYGDYMKLPPVEKQIGEHFFIAYWR